MYDQEAPMKGCDTLTLFPGLKQVGLGPQEAESAPPDKSALRPGNDMGGESPSMEGCLHGGSWGSLWLPVSGGLPGARKRNPGQVCP